MGQGRYPRTALEMSQDASEAGEAGEADGNTDPRATVHAARCLESAHCLFDSACAALRRKEHWGCTVIQKLMSHDDAFTDGLPDHGIQPILLDHVAIAVVRAAVLKGEIDGLKGYAIPCLLWLRVCEIEAHLNLEAKLREDGEAPSSQPLLAEDVAYSTAWIAGTDEVVCNSLVWIKTLAVLDSPGGYRKRLKRMNREMPNITQKEELMGALLKGTKLESAVLSTLFSDSGASAAPQLNTLYVAYTTQRDAVTRWVVEMDDDLRAGIAIELREKTDLEDSLFVYLEARDARTAPCDLTQTRYHKMMMAKAEEAGDGRSNADDDAATGETGWAASGTAVESMAVDEPLADGPADESSVRGDSLGDDDAVAVGASVDELPTSIAEGVSSGGCQNVGSVPEAATALDQTAKNDGDNGAAAAPAQGLVDEDADGSSFMGEQPLSGVAATPPSAQSGKRRVREGENESIGAAQADGTPPEWTDPGPDIEVEVDDGSDAAVSDEEDSSDGSPKIALFGTTVMLPNDIDDEDDEANGASSEEVEKNSVDVSDECGLPHRDAKRRRVSTSPSTLEDQESPASAPGGAVSRGAPHTLMSDEGFTQELGVPQSQLP